MCGRGGLLVCAVEVDVCVVGEGYLCVLLRWMCVW